MDKDIKDLLNEESKNNMPDLWDKIDKKLEPKKNKSNKKIFSMVASIAVILTIGVAGKSVLTNNSIKAENSISEEGQIGNDKIAIADEELIDKNENSEALQENNLANEASKVIEVLPDLNLEEILKDNIIASYGLSNSYIARDIDIEKEAIAVVYGKVVDVKSFLNDNLINSDLSIEVIRDYKGNIQEGEIITAGSSGGEISLDEYNKEASHPYVLGSEGEDGKDEGKRVVYGERKPDGHKVITLNKGVPQYRVGEYVLVYLFELDKEGYYSWKDEKYYEPPTANYGIFGDGKFYVNPNTKEVFRYTYDYVNEKLIKESVTTLDALENRN